jgi:hypothetical protein
MLLEPGRGEFLPPLGLTSANGEPEAVRSVLEDEHAMRHAVPDKSGS